MRQSEGLRYEIAPYLKKSGWEEAEKIRNFELQKRLQERKLKYLKSVSAINSFIKAELDFTSTIKNIDEQIINQYTGCSWELSKTKRSLAHKAFYSLRLVGKFY